MHPATHAQTDPDRVAYLMAGSGEAVTYGELDARSNQGAQLFRALGLKVGDVIAIFMENNARYFEITWAAQRAGLYYTCISSKLTAQEAAYIIKDCGARVLIASPGIGPVFGEMPALLPGLKLLAVGGARNDYASFEEARDAMPAEEIPDQTSGSDMLYSSGTTGRPKGVKPPLRGGGIDVPDTLAALPKVFFGFPDDNIYLSPAPLYHAAPLRWCMGAQRAGATVIVMEKFDPEHALALIEKHKIKTA